MGAAAAANGADVLRETLKRDGEANIIVATGASQFEMLEHLVQEPDIRWEKVTVFHLDEYVGLPITHGASFRQYLWERFHRKLPHPVKAFHYLDAETDPRAEASRVGELIRQHPIAVAFIGIGENGHIAFNDPPADFQTQEPYLVVDLDEACRKQQQGEGWFPTLADVPQQAISMSVQQILKSRHIVCTVPDERKSEAVRNAVEGSVTPDVPGSILQQHASCELFLDQPAASRLSAQAASG
jgi:glucosamine-6-phosphate deaminase